jgi:hypothetical protein
MRKPSDTDRLMAHLQEIEPLTGAARFMDRIVYMHPWQRDACVLYFSATHIARKLNTIGRLLITSTDGEAGKTTVMDMASMMCYNPWATEPNKWALQGKFRGGDFPTIILDEIHLIFGLNGQRGRSHPIYRPVVEGYRRRATFSGQIDGAPHDFSCYCPVILAGQKKAVPPDARTRCINIWMRPVPDTIDLEDSLDEGLEADGLRIGNQIHSWTQKFADLASGWMKEAHRLHPKLRGRKLQIWGSMYVIAKAAGPEWEKRFLEAFVNIALDSSEKPILAPEQQILMDAGIYLRNPETPEGSYLLSADLLEHVLTLEEDIYTRKTDRQIARLMSEGLGRASVLTLPDRHTARGWHRSVILRMVEELEDLLSPEEREDPDDEFEDFFDEGEAEDELEGDLETTETTETTVPIAEAA